MARKSTSSKSLNYINLTYWGNDIRAKILERCQNKEAILNPRVYCTFELNSMHIAIRSWNQSPRTVYKRQCGSSWAYDNVGYTVWRIFTMSEVTSSVLVLRLSWKWTSRGVKKFNIFKYCTLSIDEITWCFLCVKTLFNAKLTSC